MVIGGGSMNEESTLVSIGHLAAGVAHEINTPIQYIGDNTRFIQSAFKTTIDFLDHIQKIVESNISQQDMRSEILDQLQKIDIEFLSKEIPEAIQQSLEGVKQVTEIVKAMKEFSHPGLKEKVPTDINHALKTTITVSKNEWKYVADIKQDLDPDLPLTSCLPNEMNQVFLNLIVNAAHAIETKIAKGQEEKGLIEIQTKNKDGFVEVRIKDTGCGIPDAIKNKIFDPFFTTKEIGKGTGQGLAIAHAIVVGKHKGQFTYHSTVGEGTTFIVRLPLDQ